MPLFNGLKQQNSVIRLGKAEFKGLSGFGYMKSESLAKDGI